MSDGEDDLGAASVAAASRANAMEGHLRSCSDGAPVADERAPDQPMMPWRRIMLDHEADPSVERQMVELVRGLVIGTGVPDCLVEYGFVRACLRAKKYQPQKSAALLQAYEQFRQRAGWVAGTVSEADLHALLATGFNMLLPHPDLYGHVVVTQSMGLLDLSLPDASMERYQKVGYYLLHRALQRGRAQTHGLAMMIDFADFSFGRMLRHVRVSDLRRGVGMLQDCSPAHLDALYIANAPRWIERLLGMIRPMLRQDSLQKKLILLGAEGVAPHFKPGTLPQQLGGTLEFDWQAQLARWAAAEAEAGPRLDVSRWVGEAIREGERGEEGEAAGEEGEEGEAHERGGAEAAEDGVRFSSDFSLLARLQ